MAEKTVLRPHPSRVAVAVLAALVIAWLLLPYQCDMARERRQTMIIMTATCALAAMLLLPAHTRRRRSIPTDLYWPDDLERDDWPDAFERDEWLDNPEHDG